MDAFNLYLLKHTPWRQVLQQSIPVQAQYSIQVEQPGLAGALAGLASAGVRLTALGIQDDILYGPRQVQLLVDAATSVGVATTYRELRSDKGHDAFLVEWERLTEVLRESLAD